MTRVLVTGGAGFIGANLSVELLARHPAWELVALDGRHRTEGATGFLVHANLAPVREPPAA